MPQEICHFLKMASAYWAVIWKKLIFRAKNWLRLIQRFGLLGGKYGIKKICRLLQDFPHL